MEKKNSSELLRKLIREEVARAVTLAIRKELPKLLSESRQPERKPIFRNQSAETKKTPVTRQVSKFEDSNPMASLLNETAMNMSYEDPIMSFTTENVGPTAHPILAFQPKEVSTGNINDMFSTAIPSSNLDAVQINTVPDYSQLMDKLGL